MTSGVSIRPGVGMLSLFPHMTYKPWYALGELVDNAIQSFLSQREALRDLDRDVEPRLLVRIDIGKADGGSITVRDDAAGIASRDWNRAFMVAEPPSDATGLSQFGIGMKAACCWFARRWSVRSAALGETVTRRVDFDVPAIVASRTDELQVHEEPTAWSGHFTEVRMEDLHHLPQGRTLGKIRTYLGSMYRQFLREGSVVIEVNGEPVEHHEPDVLVAPRWSTSEPELEWRRDVVVRLESGRQVRGFAALRATGSTSAAGFSLFYRGKVVTGAGEAMFKPEEIFGRSNSFRSQRLFGELHMDDFAVTYTKDALVWSGEEEEFVALLREQLDAEPLPLLQQAEKFRSRRAAPPPEDVVEGVLQRTAGAFSGVEVETDDGPGDADTSVKHPSDAVAVTAETERPDAGWSPPDVELEVATADRDVQLQVDGVAWLASLRLVTDEANIDWLTVRPADDDPQHVAIQVNQAHPFMRAWCELPGHELEPVWRVAVALGLGQELSRTGGAKSPHLVIRRTNELLRQALATQE